MKNLASYLKRPKPFAGVPETETSPLLRKRRPSRPSPERNIVTRHRIGGEAIETPVHGMSGSQDGVLLIYNARWGMPGWYALRDYQVLKSLESNCADWRIMPKEYYERSPEPEPWVAPPVYRDVSRPRLTVAPRRRVGWGFM